MFNYYLTVVAVGLPAALLSVCLFYRWVWRQFDEPEIASPETRGSL